MCLWPALLKFWFSNWPWLWKFSHPGRQLLFTFHTMVMHWSHPAFNFYALIHQNLTGEFKRKTYPASENLVTDSWSWQSLTSYCDIFNCLFPLDVQNEIKLLSRFFCYSWLICLLGFWLTNAPIVKVIRNAISDSIVLKNKLTHFTLPDEKFEKSQAILALLDGSQELYLYWWASVIIAFDSLRTSLCAFVRFETIIWPKIRLDISLQNFKVPLDIFLLQIERNVPKHI